MLNRSVTALTTIAGLAFISTIPAAHGLDRAPPNGGGVVPQAVGDPPKVLYRTAGVRDDGGGTGLGTATSFQCSNLNAVNETMVIHIRDQFGTVRVNKAFPLEASRTKTISTHFTDVFIEDASLNAGIISQGLATISASTTNIICSVMVVNAAGFPPEGIALHLVRFNPIAGSQE